MTDEELMARLRKYEDDLLSITADRIEALTEQLTAARDDAKEAEAYAEELEKELNTCRIAQAVMDNTVAGLEAKLAKAEAGLIGLVLRMGEIARTTLAEIKGGNDAKSDL